jgi:hypothetical protein
MKKDLTHPSTPLDEAIVKIVFSGIGDDKPRRHYEKADEIMEVAQLTNVPAALLELVTVGIKHHLENTRYQIRRDLKKGDTEYDLIIGYTGPVCEIRKTLVAEAINPRWTT